MIELFSYIFKSKRYYRNYYSLTFVLIFAMFSPQFLSAQEVSTLEKMATNAYNLRFTDSIRSLQLQQEALVLAEKEGSKADQVICAAYLAMTYRGKLNLEKFTYYTELSYNTAKSLQNERALAYANWSMGLLFSYIDDKTAALNYLLKGYSIYEKLNDDEHCARLGADISYLFSIGSEDNIKKYAYEALAYSEKTKNPEIILHARLAVGNYLYENISLEDPTSWQNAVAFFKHSLKLIEQSESEIISKSNIGIAHINLAALYMVGPKPIDEAAFLSHLEQATQIGKTYNFRNIYRSSLGLRGQYFLQKGAYRTAEKLFKEGIAYQLSLPYKDNNLLASFYACLKDLAARENDYRAYFQYDQLFSEYNQIKYDENIQKILENTNARFETEKRLLRIDQLEKKNELQKKINFLSYGISAVLLSGLVFMYRSYYYRQRYYQNREHILQQQQINSELKVQLMEKETLEALSEKISLERRLLQSQMDPHFMFNLLGNIQSMILQNDRITAVSYLGKFAKLTRQVLEQSRQERISLEDEINTLKNYIELQQLRLNFSFDYHIDCEEGLDSQLLIPPLLMQPFIENAIEHGLKPLTAIRRGKLNIHLRYDEIKNILICTIVDNGIGLNESRNRKTADTHRSLSIKITNERLALMLEKNPYISLEVTDMISQTGASGCRVTLNIPIL
ncbi:sensor histidine kinase [Flavobacterium sp. NKUCC04_CG]|uniref:sensor histidine kinase n=1 Tax=Flavobacterium sp. NKUCC04_CG TaxID=2842121 RepID=UPI001C5B421B|nr:histidine kinase [Flavobacterium sp. NKUCC04_CG]MBW3518459.1 histidine kinase [Flavobacterium sp. NKUCC04_CG]